MALRSACALVATLAVVGVAAPLIGPHAAADNTDNATREPAPAEPESDETQDDGIVVPIAEGGSPDTHVALSPLVMSAPPAEVADEPAAPMAPDESAPAAQASKVSSSPTVESAPAAVMLLEVAVDAALGAESVGEAVAPGTNGAGKDAAVKVAASQAAAPSGGAKEEVLTGE